jgi:hypothetical protein
MRYGTIAALVIVPAALSQTPASALPCDNTRWCAQYSGKSGGATNCGFFTIEQQLQGNRERHRWILRAQSIL